MRVVVFSAFVLERGRPRAVGVEREVLFEERSHVSCCFFWGAIAKGACFELGQDCVERLELVLRPIL